MPPVIDGAFSYDDTTFLFSNGHYWKYTGATLLRGYPQAIETGFPGIPTSSLDAVFKWGEKVVFVKGDRYWQLHPYVDSSIRGPFSLRETANTVPLPIKFGFQAPSVSSSSSKESFVFVQGLIYKLQPNAVALKAELSSKQTLAAWLNCDIVTLPALLGTNLAL